MGTPKPRRRWTGIAIIVLAAVSLSALVTGWVMSRFVMHIPLRDQSMLASMPPDLPVQVEVVDAQGVGASPSDEGVPVRLNETLHLQADFDAQVPLAMTVRYRGAIPVKAQLPVKTEIKTRVFGVAMTLPIEGTIPLDLQLPVDLKIPVNQAVRLKFSAPVSARIDQVVHIPFKAQLDARIRFVDEALPIVVRQADLLVPLAGISLSPAAAQ